MTNLERRALLGDRKAQEECTRQGILLPCPFCGRQAKIDFDYVPPFEYNVFCTYCGVTHETSFEKENAIKDWNTRQTPPIGRCVECKHLDNTGKRPVCWHTNLPLKSENDFCSYFEPKAGNHDEGGSQ